MKTDVSALTRLRKQLYTFLIGSVIAGVSALALAATANAAVLSGSEPAPIVVPEQGKANFYPSLISLDGVHEPITDVFVTLHGVTHKYPTDLDVLLVAPDGTGVVLMSDVCGTSEIDNFTWIFRPAGLAPQMSNEPCGEFTYSATNRGAEDAWPDAPAGPYGNDLGDLRGHDPNGAWRLYVFDDLGGGSGQIKRGWSLTVETGEPALRAPSTVFFAAPADPYPLTTEVPGAGEIVTDVNVTIDPTHQWPDDLDILLEGPTGKQVMLMSDACGNRAIAATRLTFDDEATQQLPDEVPAGTGCPKAGTFKPSDFEKPDVMDGIEPDTEFPDSLAVFEGSPADGEWKLYVMDDTIEKKGFMAEGIALDLTTRPRAGVAFSRESIEIPEGESAEIEIRREAAESLGEAGVALNIAPIGSATADDLSPVGEEVQFEPGQTVVRIPVAAIDDQLPEGSEGFLVSLGNPSGDAALTAPGRTTVTIPASDAIPVVQSVRLKPSTFRAAGSRPRKRGPSGTTVTYGLSSEARVRFVVERIVPRCRRSGRCPAVRRLKGRIIRTGAPGANRFRFTGRIGKRVLKPGRYRLVATPIDSNGNQGASVRRAFRIR